MFRSTKVKVSTVVGLVVLLGLGLWKVNYEMEKQLTYLSYTKPIETPSELDIQSLTPQETIETPEMEVEVSNIKEEAKEIREAREKPVRAKTEVASRGKEVAKEKKAETNLGYKEYTMEITAYDLSYASCQKNPDHKYYGVTASGKKIGTDIFEEDGIIASAKDFPFGTVMEIEGWGTGTVYDRGGAIKFDENKGMYITDVFISDSAKVKEWGRRVCKVKVYD